MFIYDVWYIYIYIYIYMYIYIYVCDGDQQQQPIAIARCFMGFTQSSDDYTILFNLGGQ